MCSPTRKITWKPCERVTIRSTGQPSNHSNQYDSLHFRTTERIACCKPSKMTATKTDNNIFCEHKIRWCVMHTIYSSLIDRQHIPQYSVNYTSGTEGSFRMFSAVRRVLVLAVAALYPLQSLSCTNCIRKPCPSCMI